MTYFEIYRAPEVNLTSILRGGGDWRWGLHADDGALVVSGGGYRTEAECANAIEDLRRDAKCAEVRHIRPNVSRHIVKKDMKSDTETIDIIINETCTIS